ncbi:MAG: hypothetical protein IT425_08950 [Pirellulales bacterium]|nr:hypothetical protein [Pirellulales bacterium]
MRVLHASLLAGSMIVILLLATAAPVRSQPPQPSQPAAGEAAPPAAETPQPLLETNPAIRAALELPRQEPRDYVRATLWLIDLGRPELAKPILDDLMKRQVRDEQRAAIVAEFGSADLLRLARSAELAPEGAKFADACLAAAHTAATKPQRIAALVKQLADPSTEVRIAARHDLAAAGQAGVTATLETMAHESDPTRRATLADAAELMHPLVDGPLLAMLATNDSALRSEVGTLLEKLAVPQARPFLSNGANGSTAAHALAQAIARYQHGTPPFPVDADGRVELWKWDDATMKLSSARVLANDAQLIWIARLATELARLQPDDFVAARTALVLRLEAAGLTADPSAPPSTPNLAKAEPRLLNEALAEALAKGYSHAARSLLTAMGEQHRADVFSTVDGKPSPLVRALDSPSRRVRFAALEAILALNPASPYPGSSRVAESLEWFARANGERQAVVAMPTNSAATNLAGELAAHHFATHASNRGRDAVDTARSLSDLEAIFIDMNTIVPDIRQTLFELRTSPATGDVPIALLAADGRLQEAKKLATEHSRVLAISRPHSPAALASIVERLAALAPRDQVPDNERIDQAEQARKWIAMLRGGERPFYTFREREHMPLTPAASNHLSTETSPSP